MAARSDREPAEAIELGSHPLRDVPEPVVIHQIGDGDFPELRIAGSGRTNLPVAPGRLIGRERELASLREALHTSRLVTLTAAGGTGKTRLALAVGEALLHHQPGGVWFVDLSAVSRGEDVPAVIAGVLDLQLTGDDPARQVIDYLVGIDALIVLDNCEHLVDACADLLEAFVRTPGSSRILATTREYFDIDGEVAIRLSPLDAAEADGPAVELFVDRALAGGSSQDFDDDDLATIANLCSHLDGSPLAIELAAGRCGVFTPTELLDAIGERFELLRGGRRRRSRQALEDTLDWSYELLDDDEQRVFRMLAVFSGSFDRAAVAAVAELSAAGGIDLLESLTAKSLVQAEQSAESTRFRLLETPSAYAERLLEERGETDAARDRHLDHFLAATDRFVVGLMPTIDAKVLAPDRANVVAAIEWAQTRGRWQDASRLLFASYQMISVQGELVARMARRAVDHVDQIPEPDATRARGALSFISVQLDDFASAAEVVATDQASDDPMRQIAAAAGIAWFTMSSGDPAGALEQVAAARALLLAVEDGDEIARFQVAGWIELIAAWAHAQLGDFESCIERCDAAREAHERVERPTMYSSQALHAEALACAELGAFDRALRTADELDQMESIYSRADDARIVVHLLRGDAEAALPHLKANALDAATGRLSRAANDTMLFLALLAEHDDPDLAARRLMAVEHTRTPSTIACSIALAERFGVRDAFDETRARCRVDRIASGRRAIEVLRGELVDLGWS